MTEWAAVPLAALFVVLGTAKVLAVPVMRGAAAHAGLGVGAYRTIGVAELAAAVGLVAGLEWAALGILSSVGVLGLLLGAFVVHFRARDPLPRWAPAIVTAGLTIAHGLQVTAAAR